MELMRIKYVGAHRGLLLLKFYLTPWCEPMRGNKLANA
jgi:hypothetical protein